jgi:hypothetical protein
MTPSKVRKDRSLWDQMESTAMTKASQSAALERGVLRRVAAAG